MPKKTWYRIANSQGGYTFSDDSSVLVRWKREEYIKGLIEGISNEEYKLLKRHPHFNDFNDFLSSYP